MESTKQSDISQTKNATSSSSDTDINAVTRLGRSNENVPQTGLLHKDIFRKEENLQMKPQGKETSSDTDTIILDSDEDMEILQNDQLISPPPVMLSPLKDSPVQPNLRYKPEFSGRKSRFADVTGSSFQNTEASSGG